MKVKDLIERLNKLDKEKDVYVILTEFFLESGENYQREINTSVLEVFEENNRIIIGGILME